MQGFSQLGLKSSSPGACTCSSMSTARKCARALRKSQNFNGVVYAVTLFMLFGDDLRLMYTPQSADVVFSYAFFCTFTFLCFEIIITSVGHLSYIFPIPSFYFWLDFCSCCSILLDFQFFGDSILEQEVSYIEREAVIAGKASRVGTKATGIIKIIRVLRTMTVVKLSTYAFRKTFFYKGEHADKKITYSLTAKDHQNISEQDDDKIKKAPSVVSQKMIQLTNSRVILVVLACILFFPLFNFHDKLEAGSADGYFEEYGLLDLHRLVQDRNKTGGITEDLFRARILTYATQVGRVLYMEICPDHCLYTWSPGVVNSWLRQTKFQAPNDRTLPYANSKNPKTGWNPKIEIQSSVDSIHKEYRKRVEVSVIHIHGCYSERGIIEETAVGENENTCESKVYIDKREESFATAANNARKTLYMLFLLIGSSIIFMWDAEFMVVQPLERMYNLVRKLADNPLHSLSHAETTEGVEEFETAILEKTLTKIGVLLQVGFGEAGANIIAKNMGRGELRTTEPGKRVTCAFVYAQINNFADITSCLGGNAIQYINVVANIVHTCVHNYNGAANKNTGSSFLLAWRLCDGLFSLDPCIENTDEEVELPQKTESIEEAPRGMSPQQLIDSALAAILKVRVRLHFANLDGTFASYMNNPEVVERFGPNMKVNLQFGLHVGWAIEGAIGSKYKIDASYLSPNVNLSARLSSATSQYGTDMVMSGPFVKALSPMARSMCRKVDCVTVKGSNIPVSLYVFDISNYPQRFLERRFDADGRQQPVDFSVTSDAKLLQLNDPREFKQTFRKGVEEYLMGNWSDARSSLEKAKNMLPDDGPTKALLEVISDVRGQCPTTWKGFRSLDRK